MRGGGVRREEWEEWEKSEVGTRVFWFARFSEWWLVCLTQAPLSPGPLSVPHKHLGLCQYMPFCHIFQPPLPSPSFVPSVHTPDSSRSSRCPSRLRYMSLSLRD